MNGMMQLLKQILLFKKHLNPKINHLLSDLNEQLTFIDLEIDDTLVRCEEAIEIIQKSVQKLKIIFNKENFKSEDKEIDFFKNVKPKFASKLIYYNIVYKLVFSQTGKRIINISFFIFSFLSQFRQ